MKFLQLKKTIGGETRIYPHPSKLQILNEHLTSKTSSSSGEINEDMWAPNTARVSRDLSYNKFGLPEHKQINFTYPELGIFLTVYISKQFFLFHQSLIQSLLTEREDSQFLKIQKYINANWINTNIPRTQPLLGRQLYVTFLVAINSASRASTR